MESNRCIKTRGEGSLALPPEPLQPLAPHSLEPTRTLPPPEHLQPHEPLLPEPLPDRGPGEPPSQTCQHITARGHRCRRLRTARSSLCSHHAGRLAASQRTDEAVAAELLAEIDDFSSAASVNLFLGNLLKQLARKRIRRRDAIALAYISQLLLNSLAALNREQSRAASAEPEICIINDMPRPQRDLPPVPTELGRL